MIKYNTLIFIFIGLLLSACTQPAEDPKTVADKYWQYIQSGNISEAEKLASANSSHMMQRQSSRMNSATQLNNSGAKTIINTTITTIHPDNNMQYTETFNTVLVLQQGKWKVDVEQSQIPEPPASTEKDMEKLADELSESMQKNIESMDDAVSHGMRMLNEAMRDGSKEMGDSLLQMMNELNNTMQESVDKMKQRREQQMQEQPPHPQPDPRQGEGII